MSHETPIITAEPRERTGSRFAQRLRKAGRLPAVIYGHKSDPQHVSVDQKTMLTLLHHGIHVINVDVAGGPPETCLVKDLQFGYLGDDVIHIDFARVDLDEEVSVQVHINFVGTPAEAHHAGAILRHDHTELGVRCKVSDIPEEIKVDLAKMEGHHMTAGDVELPPELSLSDDPSTILASVSFVRHEVAVGEEAEVAVEGAEPEVITEAKAAEAEAGADAGTEAETES